MTVAREVAEILLRSGAVAINLETPFVYASGIRSPIYTDNRLLLSLVPERRRVTELLAELAPPDVEVVAGTATAGIPWAAWVAERLGRPMVYVRAEAKAHGRGRRIEGALAAGQRALVVEDLVTTGRSALGTVAALRDAGAVVRDVLAIFSYDLAAARQAFERAGVRLSALMTLGTLLDVAAERGQIGPAARGAIVAALAAAVAEQPSST
jgi:orotate phosphoribosyltransferase